MHVLYNCNPTNRCHNQEAQLAGLASDGILALPADLTAFVLTLPAILPQLLSIVSDAQIDLIAVVAQK